MQAKSITFRPEGEADPLNCLMHPGGRPTERKRTELGERIAGAREAAGISQYELAERLGVTQPTVVAWERKAANIRSDTLAKLAAALEVSADELLGIKPPSRRAPGGRGRQLFDELAKLPRRQQQNVLDLIEDAIEGQRRRSQEKKAS